MCSSSSIRPIAGVAKLGWKVELAMALDQQWLVVVDAVDGERMAAYNKVHFAGVPGRGVDLLNVNRPLQVYQDAPNLLHDRHQQAHVSGGMALPLNAATRGGITILDARHAGNGNYPEGTYKAYYVNSAAADSVGCLMRECCLRVVGGIRLLPGATPAQFLRWERRYGRRDCPVWQWLPKRILEWKRHVFRGCTPYAGALDLVGHEMTHAVTEKTANLEYKDQSGALNEAFSDVFGEAVEARTNGRNDWLLAPSVIGRNLQNPGARTFSCPKYPDPQPFPARMSEFIPREAPVLNCYIDNDNGGYTSTAASSTMRSICSSKACPAQSA
jgi:hypothetical protein